MIKTVKLKVETIDGHPVFQNLKEAVAIPNRLDAIFYEGKNYKVVYRKFIYNVANNDLSTIILKVEQIENKF